jgi:hypothetical protein
MNPNMHKDIYNKLNTFDDLFNLLDNKIEAKNIAFILVGVPK